MKTNWIITLSIIISCCIFMFSCVNEDETSSIARTYTQEQYGQMFKENIVDTNKHISINNWITPKSLANYISNH
jgi:hypothetical protein